MVTAIASDLRRGSRCSDFGFLQHCSLCRKKLLPAKDIYMYQGDKAFCSVECREKQMIMDEEEVFRSENYSPASSGGHRRDPRNRAGGFAY